MRTITGPELTTLMGATVAHFLKVEVQNGSGTYKDLTALGSVDWVNGVSINSEAIDTPIATATVLLKREHNGVILSPLVTSTLNVNDLGAYSPLIDPGRTIRISVAVMAAGATPSGGDWKEMFLGRVDGVAWDADPIRVECSDLGAWLMDTQIEAEDEYGSGAGVAVETVMQDIATAWPSGILSVPTLYTPTSPGWLLHEYKQDRVKVLEALRALAQQIGYDCRYRYDASNALRLTFWAPDRAKTVADATIGPTQYTDVTQLKLELADIRNTCKVVYRKTDGTVDSVPASDAASISHFGRRYMEIQEGDASNIDTSVEAQLLADAAVHDLADPVAEQEVKLFLFWPAQLGDLYTFTQNGKHYTSDQKLAVVGVRHEFRDGAGVTYLTVRGSVAGSYADWLRIFESARVLPAVVSVVPSLSPTTGELKVSINCNSITGSFRAAISTSGFPTAATVRAATAVNGASGTVTFTGPYVTGDALYISVLAYSGKDGGGDESAKFDLAATAGIWKTPLLVTIAQTASTGFSDPAAGVYPTCTLTLVVSDPTGLLTGTAQVIPVFQGIQALYNDTLGAAATTFNATLGTTYTFTATLNKALEGGGFAKFTASKVGGFSGYATWWSSSAWADAPADTIITILNNTSSSDVTAKASLTVNVADNVDTMKWLANKTGTGLDLATVKASGASVSVGPPFSVADLGVNLALGETVYVSIVLYDYNGVALDKLYTAKATRTSLSKSKTIQWAAAGWFHPVPNAGFYSYGDTWVNYNIQRTLDELWIRGNVGLTLAAPNYSLQVASMSFIMADGGTVTSMTAEVWGDNDATYTADYVDVIVKLFAVALGASTDSASPIASVSDSQTGAWETCTPAACSQSTTGKRFTATVEFYVERVHSASDFYGKFRSFTITYLPSDQQATV